MKSIRYASIFGLVLSFSLFASALATCYKLNLTHKSITSIYSDEKNEEVVMLAKGYLESIEREKFRKIEEAVASAVLSALLIFMIRKSKH